MPGIGTGSAKIHTTLYNRQHQQQRYQQYQQPVKAKAPLQVVTSMGSIGHPFACNEACKYAKKPKGCKDGAACTHCHECTWHRQNRRREELQTWKTVCQ